MKINHKRLFLSSFSFIFFGWALGQPINQYAIISGGGSSTAIVGYTVDYTIGEIVIATIGTNPIFTEGLQQPSNNVVLPVNLIDFSAVASGSKALLSWSTSTEINNQLFKIERSTDGVNFSSIGVVDSKALNGNSNALLQYGFTDIYPGNGKNYYRLQQADKDGKMSYSNIVVLTFTIDKPSLLVIYPNPVKSLLYLRYGSLEKATITIYNMFGQIMKVEKIGGSVQGTLDVSYIPSGIYTLKYNNGTYELERKFIKF